MIWDVDPFLFHVDGLFPGVRWYGVWVLFGIACALLATAYLAERLGVPPKRVTAMLFVSTPVAYLGGHLGHLVFYEPESLTDVTRLVAIGSGQASLPAVFAVLLALWLLARLHGESARVYLDAGVWGGVFLIPLWRLGNFMNSELVGRPWDGPWAVGFPRYDCVGYPGYELSSGWFEVSCDAVVLRHPAQLYEALLGLLLIGGALYLHRTWSERLQPGAIALLVLFAYSVARFLVEYTYEFQRLDTEASPLTMGQWLSLPSLVVTGGLLIALRTKLTSKPLTEF